MKYALLSYDPCVYVCSTNNNSPLEVLQEDYNFIRDNGLYGVIESQMVPFKMITGEELCNLLDAYLDESGKTDITVMCVGSKEYTKTYSKRTLFYANSLKIVYPTYTTNTEYIKRYARDEHDNFVRILESSMDLSLKNYTEGVMGAFNTKLEPDPLEPSADLLGYIAIPIMVEHTPVLSFSETREDAESNIKS